MTQFLQRTALIALATGVLGACSTTDEALTPNFPIRAPETNTPPAPAPAPAAVAPTPAPADAPTAAAPAAPVESRPLEPLAPAPPAKPAPPRAAAPPPAPAYQSVTTRSVTGKVVEVEGRAVSHKVRKGDTLDEIADKLGTSVAQLRADNGLKKHAKIHPGQVIKGPRTRAHAYVVGTGDTLYSIARRFNVSADDLREENGLSRSAGLHAGEKVRLPEGYRDHGPLTTTTRVLVAQSSPASEPEGNGDAPEAEAPPPPATPPRTSPQPPPAAAVAPPAYRTVTTRGVTGRVVEVEGRAVTYRVRKGDNLAKIARKLDTTVEQLREDNDLRRREAIHPGEVLKGPRTTAKAYVVGAGDTLFSVAKRFGVSADELREENELSRGAGLHAGQKLRLPEGYRDHGPLTTTTRVALTPPAAPQPPWEEQAPPPPAAQPPASQPLPPPAPAVQPPRSTTPAPAPYTPPARPYTPPPAPPRPYTPVPPPYTAPYTPSAAPPPAAAPTPADAQISELGRGRFVWPLQGPIVSDFGPKPTGLRNDGINIGAPVGASVRAAAAGDVVYAGDQVPGFGNLVLIKHADGWVTAYGHLSRALVKMQQKVFQGQEIGLAGATGGVSEPQLHFEIRFAPGPLERAKPIDPKLVLPK
jgi:murein DD-endopeptidase MepM/ murein hydrolase activator NlpD